MKTAAAPFVALTLLAGQGCGPDPLAGVQDSHIAQNAPASADFNRFLRRDLEAYFAGEGLESPTVRFELLRNGPTQTGMSYPKYYAWVAVSSGGVWKGAGAVRLAAIEGKRFKVTDYVSKEDILAGEGLNGLFPAALVPAIRERAARR